MWKETGVTFDVLFRLFMAEMWKMTKTEVYRSIFESETSRKKNCKCARTWHAVTISVADQRTALHFKLLTSFKLN